MKTFKNNFLKITPFSVEQAVFNDIVIRSHIHLQRKFKSEILNIELHIFTLNIHVDLVLFKSEHIRISQRSQ